MDTSRSAVLRQQFDLVWSLLDYHLDRLVAEDFLWEPADLIWTMRESEQGSWVPDWADSEPDPIPVPTIAWLSWHIGWWWSVTMDHLRQQPPRDRAAIHWPGPDATVDWLRRLRTEWDGLLGGLTEADLEAPIGFPWQDDPTKATVHTIAWVNAELMKNAAEIGQLRLLRAAGNR
ncbi:DinB family protein [Nocardia sp. NPDC050406]|uniref:DinB family protein n=1 Tax=Nocardia sp. NPDC050406 TaxID=3364318 RepID=UPI0037A22D95